MDSQKQQLIERLQGATNILVTVSANPSVDQLAACIGLTLLLNEAGKRATAVYSGETPSTIEFLQPEATIEKDTNSLRDFIIALDKAKADKLRYKVEDEVVKIFITPYKTSLSQKDLDFSQGDFNIDVVVALGVHQQEDLDQAIIAHGRILHDATVVSINNTPDGGQLGSINWQDLTASSLSEQVASLAPSFDKVKLDEQISTALLTGIVAETDRFSNAKTTAATMTLSASLMAAGANQQLVASELDKPEPQPEVVPDTPVTPDESPTTVVDEASTEAESPVDQPSDDGSLIFTHEPDTPLPAPVVDDAPAPAAADIAIDADGSFRGLNQPAEPTPAISEVKAIGAAEEPAAPTRMTEPPANNPMFTANTESDNTENTTIDPLTQEILTHEPLLSRSNGVDLPVPDAPASSPVELAPTPPADTAAADSEIDKTLADIEADVKAEENQAQQATEAAADLDSARSAVDQAIKSNLNQPLEPIAALNAQPLGEPLSAPAPTPTNVYDTTPDQSLDMPLPTIVTPPVPTPPVDPNSPPPVPPPMMPPFAQ